MLNPTYVLGNDTHKLLWYFDIQTDHQISARQPDFIIIKSGCHRRINKGSVGLGNKRTNGDHPNYCVIEIGQNTEKNPGDLRRLAVTQTSVIIS